MIPALVVLTLAQLDAGIDVVSSASVKATLDADVGIDLLAANVVNTGVGAGIPGANDGQLTAFEQRPYVGPGLLDDPRDRAIAVDTEPVLAEDLHHVGHLAKDRAERRICHEPDYTPRPWESTLQLWPGGHRPGAVGTRRRAILLAVRATHASPLQLLLSM